MRPRTFLLTAAPLLFLCALGACDASRTVAPIENEPLLLIGDSPLRPLLTDPLQADLWWWTDPKTSETRYAVTIDVLAREDLFEDPVDRTMRFVGSVDFMSAAGKTVAAAGPEPVAVSSVDPQASGTDGYALVVIALPLTDPQSRALEAALAQGPVEMDVVVEVVASAKDGGDGDDLLDDLGGLLLADPRPSPLPIPDEFLY